VYDRIGHNVVQQGCINVLPKQPLILASASPRRKELLASLGLNFTVIPSPVDESSIDVAGLSPAQIVEKLALIKAQTVAKQHPYALVVGADTIVVLNNSIYGKPKDEADAIRMLSELQGHRHQVFTGLAIVQNQQVTTAVETTQVWMKPLTLAERQAYVATGEPLDKAGAYAIQGVGSTLIPRVEGCYFNVVGLPLHRLCHCLAEHAKTNTSDLSLN
jgi:septum formation protein